MGLTISATLWIRIGIGLLQGLCLLALFQVSGRNVWPATDGELFAALFAMAFCIPPLLILSVGNLGWRTLLLWSVIAAVMCAGLAAYDIYRDPIISSYGLTFAAESHDKNISRIFPSFAFWLSIATILFIVHTLTISAARDRNLLAAYPTYFDVSWKHGLQFVLALLFVGLFWAVLFLGGELFRLLRIESFANLIERQTFWIPVAAVAFSGALHVSDTRINIVQGPRTLSLIVLSWLLPPLAAISVAFVIALVFTGLEPLWGTGHAAGILLAAAAMLVFLMNAIYQDGRAERAAVLRYASLLAAVVLVVLVALAAYGLLVRIQQYGLTPTRIGAIACIVVGACYGVGYAVAAARSGVQLRGLESTNLFTALVIVAAAFLLCSPFADPDRISVADQLLRLHTGLVPPAKFDFAFLRVGAGRRGVEALRELATNAQGPEAAAIAERAGNTLAGRSPADARVKAVGPEQRAQNITVVYPKGASLPKSFFRQDWSAIQSVRPQLPECLIAEAKCNAVLINLDGDGIPEILLFDQMAPRVSGVFKSGPKDEWKLIGTIENINCPEVRDALNGEHFVAVEPSLKDIDVGGERLRISTPWCK